MTRDRLLNQHGAGDECQLNSDSDTHSYNAASHLSVTSLLEDIQSSDLQFHSIHLTNRSLSSCLHMLFPHVYATAFFMVERYYLKFV